MVDAASIRHYGADLFHCSGAESRSCFTDTETTARETRWYRSPNNDGLLLWYDTIVAHGYLLGYVNADHLAIAVPISQQVPPFSFLFKDDVPRAAIARAAIEVVAQALESFSPIREPPA